MATLLTRQRMLREGCVAGRQHQGLACPIPFSFCPCGLRGPPPDAFSGHCQPRCPVAELYTLLRQHCQLWSSSTSTLLSSSLHIIDTCAEPSSPAACLLQVDKLLKRYKAVAKQLKARNDVILQTAAVYG